MKIISLTILVTLAITTLSYTTNKTDNKLDVIGEAFNTDSNPVQAVAYADAVRNTYTLPESSDFVKPEMVIKLPEVHFAPKPGPMEAVDEIPSPTDYYKGDLHLNKVDIKCKIYSNPTDCVNQSTCGWCGSTNSCITGNNVGPLEPCVKGQYIFSQPQPNWDPRTRIINNENVGGVQMTVIAK